jgi:hypothetical protein
MVGSPFIWFCIVHWPDTALWEVGRISPGVLIRNDKLLRGADVIVSSAGRVALASGA